MNCTRWYAVDNDFKVVSGGRHQISKNSMNCFIRMDVAHGA
ncbi:hypothetical protein [Bradyrhizobium sp. JYMT SZCCT0428]|nr:hypothetical protein [Bradyrhizobium sp. JYMT SZCCT0428]